MEAGEECGELERMLEAKSESRSIARGRRRKSDFARFTARQLCFPCSQACLYSGESIWERATRVCAPLRAIHLDGERMNRNRILVSFHSMTSNKRVAHLIHLLHYIHCHLPSNIFES